MSGVEAVAVTASVIAIIQMTDRIVGFCKFYMENCQDAPSDLRVILLEVSALKTIFENLQFITSCNSDISAAVRSLSNPDGPIESCRKSISELEKLFPCEHIPTNVKSQRKRRKLKVTLAALAWPLKEAKAKKLLNEISQYKATINLALTTGVV
jgi:hypothetical protein